MDALQASTSNVESNNSKRTQCYLILLLSRFFERLVFYGWRATIAIYVIGDVNGALSLAKDNFATYLSAFLLAIYLVALLSGVIADFVTGSFKILMLGFAVSIAGLAVISLSSSEFVYAGIGVLIFGIGLIKPNFAALIGLNFLDKPNAQVAAFAGDYIVINLAAFLSGITISILLTPLSFTLQFLILGFILLIPLIILLLNRHQFTRFETTNRGKTRFNQKGFFSILSLGLAYLFFWTISDLFSANQAQLMTSQDLTMLAKGMLQLLPVVILLMGCLVLVFIKPKLKQWPFFLMLASIPLLFVAILTPLTAENISSQLSDLYLIIGCIGLAEALFAPALFAALFTHVKSKLVATSIAFLGLMSAGVGIASGFLSTILGSGSEATALVLVVIFGAFVFLSYFFNRKESEPATG